MAETRRSRKRDNTHRAIMHSAKLLFEENGISNVTIENIAEKADVSRSTFFSHFTSVDDLLTQIANEEIDDILSSASPEDGSLSINAIFKQLNDDTYPYPYLMSELVTRSILSEGNSSLAKAFAFMRSEIEKDGFNELLKYFTPSDISAFIFGSYFGLVFQKFIDNEPFDDPNETNDKIQRFINYLKKQEEPNNE